jgi:hypothetical protein
MMVLLRGLGHCGGRHSAGRLESIALESIAVDRSAPGAGGLDRLDCPLWVMVANVMVDEEGLRP